MTYQQQGEEEEEQLPAQQRLSSDEYLAQQESTEGPNSCLDLEPIVKRVKVVARKLPFVPAEAHEYTWKELQEIEQRRRNVLPRVTDGFWEVLTHWDGTCLRFLATDVLLWSSVIVYIVIRIIIRTSDTVPGYVDTLTSGNIAIVGGFLSFFLVLYVNKSHARYFELYGLSMSCKGRIFDVAALSVVYLPKPTAMRLIRYMNAAHISGYVGLNNTYPARTFFTHMNKDLGLLSEAEMTRMNKIDMDKGGSCNRELIVWALRVIQQCHASGMIDNELANQFRQQVLQLRASIGKLYNAADLPVPFFYVHFICLLTFMYLPLFAVSAAFQAGTGDQVFWTVDVVGALVVLFQAMFVIGLRILGQYMSDPFGDDLTDLSVIFYCTFTWRMSNRMLEASYTDEDVEDEVKLKQERAASIGEAWETNESNYVNA